MEFNIKMSFPDQIHLLQLQKELWSQPVQRAALMVGAGCSLNAQPLPGAATSFSTWTELVRNMYDELYPINTSLSEKQQEAREIKFHRSNALRLASEYEAAFERGKLDQLIRRENPDSLHKPSKLHEMMMQLPWKDVFTTNYDTLLERTEAPSRPYSTVASAEDLTRVSSPRIVKLHGSFSSNSKLIITEEDYRKYPIDSAPFVNTVQQSLLENSLVLVGFSGEDPNFLAWTGWIRDELKNHHSPIYLVGLLAAGNVERQLLKKRGVTPIDLHPLFEDSDPDEKHKRALKWFFESLQRGKPAPPDTWLKNVNDMQTKSPIEFCTNENHKKNPVVPKLPQSRKLTYTELAKLMDCWAFERNEYPGWIVCPKGKRNMLWRRTKEWIPYILNSLESLSTPDTLLVLRELAWRMETIMAPLYTDITDQLRTAIDDFSNYSHSTEETESVFIDCEYLVVSTVSIGNCWLELAYCDMQEARETYNSDRWIECEKHIARFLEIEFPMPDRFTYEKILWSVWNSDISAANEYLDSWQSANMPIEFKILKAGLLGEFDRVIQATQILQDTLSDIRTSIHTQGHNLKLLSLEGWCSYILFQLQISNDRSLYFDLFDRYSVRWNELDRYDCDPRTTITYFNQELEKPSPKLTNPSKKNHDFDTGHVSTKKYLSSDNFTPLIPAYSFIRLFEKVGLPMRLKNVQIAGPSLLRACEWIEKTIGYWSPAIVIRSGDISDLENMKIMRRIGIANLKTEVASQLYQFSFNSSKRELNTLGNASNISSSKINLLVALIEIQSRIVFKVSEKDINDGFELAIEFYSTKQFEEFGGVNNALNSWFRRLFNAASDSMRFTWIGRMIEIPIQKIIDDDNSKTFDPFLMTPEFEIEFRVKDESTFLRVSDKIKTLLEMGSNPLVDKRGAIFERLLKLRRLDLLNEEQVNKLAALIWKEYEQDGFPFKESIYFYANYLNTPYPPELDIAERVKNKILSLEPSFIATPAGGNSHSISLSDEVTHYFREIIFSSKPLFTVDNVSNNTINWSEQEAKHIFKNMSNWWSNDKAILGHDSSFDVFGTQSRVHHILKMFDEVLTHVVIPRIAGTDEAQWVELISLITEVEKSGFLIVKCLPSILIKRPDQHEKVQSKILVAFHADEQSCSSAAKAICHWYSLANHELVTTPKNCLIEALVDTVSFRRPVSIIECTHQLTTIIANYPIYLSLAMFDQLAKSLIDWHGLLYDSSTYLRPKYDYYVDDIPRYRECIGILAGALSNWHQNTEYSIAEPPGINIWKNACSSDSLPEVKRAFTKYG